MSPASGISEWQCFEVSDSLESLSWCRFADDNLEEDGSVQRSHGTEGFRPTQYNATMRTILAFVFGFGAVYKQSGLVCIFRD